MWNWKQIPPAGHTIAWSDLVGGTNVPHDTVYWFNSGTTALWFLLKNLAIPHGSHIAIPAYTCPSVAAAVIRSGHFPILVDISPDTLQLKWDELTKKIDQYHVKAVIGVNHFGFNNEVPHLDIPVIVDNAQADFQLKPIPNAVAAIYSFGRGKVLNALSGGSAVIYSPDSFLNLSQAYREIPRASGMDIAKFCLQLCGYKFFFNPVLYPIPQSIPWLKLGETIFNENFTIASNPKLSNIIIANLLQRKELLFSFREMLQQRYHHIFGKIPGIDLFEQRTYLKFPLLIGSEELSKEINELIAPLGMRLFKLYPLPLNRQPGLDVLLKDESTYEGAELISQSLYTLPLNEFITEKKLDKLETAMEHLN